MAPPRGVVLAGFAGTCIACIFAAMLLAGSLGRVELGSLGSLEAMAHSDSGVGKGGGQKAEIHKALHHLSSSALVQRAASECAKDAKCVPSVNELVKRAASACAKDPACVCDWGRYPKQCFLSEVQRHEGLVRAAKKLEASIHQDVVASHERHQELSTLESDDKKLKETLAHGREALAARNFEGAKTALAKAEYLHQLTVCLATLATPLTFDASRNAYRPSGFRSRGIAQVREAGNTKGPVQKRQEEELKRFARDVVQVEAHSKGEDDHSAARAEAVQKGKAKVEKQIAQLTKNMGLLMKTVGNIEKKSSGGGGSGDAHSAHSAHSQGYLAGNPADEMRMLAKEIGVLTGKVGQLQAMHSRRASAGRGRHEGFTQPRSSDSQRVSAVRASSLSHQETTFSQAIVDGERAAERGDTVAAKTALSEARYYHSEIVRLRGGSPSESCRPCEALEGKIARTAHSEHQVAEQGAQGARTSGLDEEQRRRDRERESGGRWRDRGGRERGERRERRERAEGRKRDERWDEQDPRERGPRSEEGRTRVGREEGERGRDERGREPRMEPGSAAEATEREQALEGDFDSRLSRGESELMHGRVRAAAADAGAARRALVRLEGRKLRENDGEVKAEMEGALRHFDKDLRQGEASARAHADKVADEVRRRAYRRLEERHSREGGGGREEAHGARGAPAGRREGWRSAAEARAVGVPEGEVNRIYGHFAGA